MIAFRPHTRISTPNGDVVRFVRSDVVENTINEVYFTFVNQYSIKAWRKHNTAKLWLACPVGQVLIVWQNLDSTVSSQIVGPTQADFACVEPGTWFGLQGIGEEPNLIVSVSSIFHHPDEVERIPVEAISFKWRSA